MAKRKRVSQISAAAAYTQAIANLNALQQQRLASQQAMALPLPPPPLPMPILPPMPFPMPMPYVPHAHLQHNQPLQSAARPPPPPPLLPLSSINKPTHKTPPNYAASLADAALAATPFTRTQVSLSSSEHSAVMDLIHPLGSSVIRIDRIVNPVLNDRFNARRTELLKLKSRDSDILKQCGLSDSQIALKIQADMQWDNVHGSALPEYRDNCALLFHGSRASVDDVLSQGLDCRMGKGGLLGRGIYFADSPFKSLNYDSNSTLFIFQVFLGDCLLIPSYSSVQQSVREPLKSDAQKRNKSDLFFDSIVAQPNPGVNEYVIYNSHQCLPLYAITYNRATIGANGPSAQMSFPPFAWRSSGDPVSPPTVWKFNAYTVFDLMSSDSREPVAPAIIEPIIQWKCGHCEAMNDDDFLTCLTCGSSKIPSTRRKRKSPVKQHSVGRVLGTVEILDSDDEDQSFYKKSQSAKNHPLESLGSGSPSATLASSPITSAYTGPICIDTDDSPIIRAPVKKQVLNLGVIALDDSDNDSSTSIHRTQQTSSAKTPSRNPAQLNQADIFSIDSSPASAPPKQTNPSGDIVDLTGDTPSPAITTTPNTENSTKPVLAPNPEPELEDCPICATESFQPPSPP